MRNIQQTVLYRWFNEVWNEGREDSIDELMTGQAIAHGIVAPDQPKGPAGFKSFYSDFRNQFDNIQIEIKDVIAQDDMEAAHTDVTAIHRETGREVRFSGLCLVRIEDGKIAEARNEYNFLSMYQQLGQVLTPLAEA